MTRKTRAQERIDEIDVSPTTLIAQIEELTGQLAAASKQSDEYLSALQRERAEFLNFKRRTAEERQRDLGLASDDLIRKVLAVADDFDRAIDARPAELADNAWAEGIAAIDRKLRSPARERGRQPDRRGPRPPVRSPRARGDRQRARDRPARGRDRRRAPPRLPPPRPDPAAGLGGRRRIRHEP